VSPRVAKKTVKETVTPALCLKKFSAQCIKLARLSLLFLKKVEVAFSDKPTSLPYWRIILQLQQLAQRY
jgi:hypothetical protein